MSLFPTSMSDLQGNFSYGTSLFTSPTKLIPGSNHVAMIACMSCYFNTGVPHNCLRYWHRWV